MPFSVDALCARMREVPESFLPPLNEKLVPIMNAFVADTIMHISGQLPEANAVHLFDFRTVKSSMTSGAVSSNSLSMIYLAVWLFNDPSFQRPHGSASSNQALFLKLIENHLKPLSELVDVLSLIEDSDRREEFVRICLSAMRLSVEGESETESIDRLQALDSVARNKLIKAAQQRRKEADRKRQIAEEARRKKQQEQAARYNREW